MGWLQIGTGSPSWEAWGWLQTGAGSPSWEAWGWLQTSTVSPSWEAWGWLQTGAGSPPWEAWGWLQTGARSPPWGGHGDGCRLALDHHPGRHTTAKSSELEKKSQSCSSFSFFLNKKKKSINVLPTIPRKWLFFLSKITGNASIVTYHEVPCVKSGEWDGCRLVLDHHPGRHGDGCRLALDRHPGRHTTAKSSELEKKSQSCSSFSFF